MLWMYEEDLRVEPFLCANLILRRQWVSISAYGEVFLLSSLEATPRQGQTRLEGLHLPIISEVPLFPSGGVGGSGEGWRRLSPEDAANATLMQIIYSSTNSVNICSLSLTESALSLQLIFLPPLIISGSFSHWSLFHCHAAAHTKQLSLTYIIQHVYQSCASKMSKHQIKRRPLCW